MTYYEPIAYFISRLMYSLNSFASHNNMYCKENQKILFCGLKIPYTTILQYERVVGKIIFFPTFISTTEDEKIVINFAGRKQTKLLYQKKFVFSTIIYITNLYKNNWVSNAIDIQNESIYMQEKEFVFQPFSFFHVKNVKINISDYTADIYLETIGKKEILEEQIQKGKEIEYNKEENIIQIKQ